MEGAVRALTSSTASTVDGSCTATATPIISASRTTATEPGGLTWTVNRPTTSEIPSTPRSIQSIQPTSLSYATVTKARHHPPSASQSSTQPTSLATTPSPMKPTETIRHHRTQILRRLPYNTTTKQIIDDVTRQLGYTEDALFERVPRDPKDSRRFYLTYRTDDLRQYTTRKGFYIKHLHIKPTDGSTNGYIPFPSYYIDEETLRELLQSYGTIVTGGTKLHTRIAGYKFSIEFHKETSPPTSIMYNGCTMEIKYDDDLRQCKYCGRYGHLIGKCRTKAADDLIHKQREKLKKITCNSISRTTSPRWLTSTRQPSSPSRARPITMCGKRLPPQPTKRDLGDAKEMFNDNMDLLQYPIEKRQQKLDDKYQRAGGGGGLSRQLHG